MKIRCALPVVATLFIGWQRLKATACRAVAGVATAASDSRFLYIWAMVARWGFEGHTPPFRLHAIRVDDVQAGLATSRQPIVFGLALVVASGNHAGDFQCFDDATQAIAMSGLDQRRFVEQVQAIVAHQFPVTSAVNTFVSGVVSSTSEKRLLP